jgi:hypothetical protein
MLRGNQGVAWFINFVNDNVQVCYDQACLRYIPFLGLNRGECYDIFDMTGLHHSSTAHDMLALIVPLVWHI